MEKLYGLSRHEASRVLWLYGHELSEFLVELEEFETGFVGFRLDEAGFCHLDLAPLRF